MSSLTIDTDAKSNKDIFISYSRRDKEWVNSYLRPLLEAADLSFAIDDQDFDVGAPLDVSIRDLIKSCRYTLMVLTPDYVRGKWTNYELELAHDRQSNENRINVLALVLRDCDIPADVSPNLYLDIRRARTRDEEISKLLSQLQVTAEGIDKAQRSVSKKPHWFLVNFIDTEPEIQQKLSAVEVRLEQIQKSNYILTKNKTLHDRLQQIEFPMRELMWQFPERVSDDLEQINWSRAWGATSALCESLEKLVGFADQVDRELVDTNFVVVPFQSLEQDINDAFENQNTRKFRSYINMISQHVGRCLPLVNDRIVQHVKKRNLDDLANSLQSIYEDVQDIEFNELVSNLLGEFRNNIETLVELELTLQKEVVDHETLQNTDTILRLCNPDNDPSYLDIYDHWTRVNRLINSLKLQERYVTLFEKCCELSGILSDGDVVRDDRFEESVKRKFHSCVLEIRKSFNKLDIDLLSDCGKLEPKSDKLGELLTRMKNYDDQQ